MLDITGFQLEYKEEPATMWEEATRKDVPNSKLYTANIFNCGYSAKNDEFMLNYSRIYNNITQPLLQTPVAYIPLTISNR